MLHLVSMGMKPAPRDKQHNQCRAALTLDNLQDNPAVNSLAVMHGP